MSATEPILTNDRLTSSLASNPCVISTDADHTNANAKIVTTQQFKTASFLPDESKRQGKQSLKANQSYGHHPDETDANNRKTLNYLQQPVCDRFGFIVDDDKSRAANMRDFKVDDSVNIDELTEKKAIAKMAQREKKWLVMLRDWDQWISSKRFEHTKKRCRKGIPSALRGEAWFHLSGGHISLRNCDKLYEKLEKEAGDSQVVEEIRKDIHRQFPNHELFCETNGLGQQNLFSVLKCFSIARKDTSYCQGLAPVASILLMYMPPAHAFWSLIAITDHYIPGYYLPGFQAVKLHGRMLFSLLKKHAPMAHGILKKAEIDPVLYMFEWFICLFVRNLPWATVLRIWDMFLCEGIVIIFKAAIVVLATTLTSSHKKLDQHEVLQLLKNIPEIHLVESVFIPKVLKLNLTDDHLKREHSRQLRNTPKGK